jgi:hypothetical protein
MEDAMGEFEQRLIHLVERLSTLKDRNRRKPDPAGTMELRYLLAVIRELVQMIEDKANSHEYYDVRVTDEEQTRKTKIKSD